MRSRRSVLAILVLAATSAVGFAPAPSPPGLGALDAEIERARREFAIPGLALAVVKDGRVVMSRGYGVKRLGGTEPVDARTLFAIASNTKAFTAAALGLLAQDGKLSWDDPV